MRKVSLTILLILVMILSSITVVNAEEGDTATFSLTTTNTDVKVGDEVTVNIVIDTLNGFSGIREFAALKVFDPTIFEYKGTVGQNGFEVKGDGEYIVLVSNTNTSSGIIAVMTFKVLKEVDDATIKIDELDVTGDDGDVYFEDGNVNSPSVKFEVTSNEVNPDTNPGTNPDTNPGTNSGSGTTNSGSSASGNKTNNDKTTATGSKIPQAGESYVSITLFVAGIILAVILFAKYKIFDNATK